MRRTSERDADGEMRDGGLPRQCGCNEVSDDAADTVGARFMSIDMTLMSLRAAVSDSAASRNMPSCVLQSSPAAATAGPAVGDSWQLAEDASEVARAWWCEAI